MCVCVVVGVCLFACVSMCVRVCMCVCMCEHVGVCVITKFFANYNTIIIRITLIP